MQNTEWIGWEGWNGVQDRHPDIHPGRPVVVMCRNGEIQSARYAGDLRWFHVDDIPPSMYPPDYDIVAYRLA